MASGTKKPSRIVKQVLDVNPLEARAWAYRAVMAHLRGDKAAEAVRSPVGPGAMAVEPRGRPSDRPQALAKVPLRRGVALFRSWRWRIDPDYLPAKVQLCQDLLRLGDEAEGWKLAAEIFSKDGYNVVAYNLVTLRDRLAGFRTIEGDGFVVRMDKREADLYGSRVLALLSRARKTLCEKYEVAHFGAGHRRDFSAAQGIRGANFRAARGRRSAGCLLWTRRSRPTARPRRASTLRTGRPCCGMSFAMWSP